MSIQQQIKKNLRHNYIVNFFDGTAYWLAASFFATRTILPLFISQLTDSTLAIGILSAVISTGTLLPQLFTANWVQRQAVKKDIVVKVGFFSERLPILLLVLAAWMASWSKPTALIFGLLCITWRQFGGGVISVGWQDMYAKLFPIKTRGRFMGITFFAGTVAGIIGAGVAAWILDNYSFPINFMITFAWGAFFMLISWISLALTKEPPDPPKNTPSTKTVDWTMIGRILKEDHNFRKYVISSIFIPMGMMAIGFLTVYTLDRWQVPNSQVGVYTTFMLVGQAVGYLVFGWLADRYGHKIVLEISILLSAFSYIVALLASTPEIFYLVFALQGIYFSAWVLSGINIVFEFCEAELRPIYIGLANTVIGVFSALAPLLGGLLVEWLNYSWLFGISMVFSLLGVIALRFWVVEPRNNHK
jgi:MFS family permease